MEEILKLNEKLQESIAAKSEQYAILESLAEIFYSLHVINLLDDTVTEYNAKDEVKEIVNHRVGAIEMMRQVMSSTLILEHREAALKFTDLTTISERMKNKKVLSAEFIGSSVGWFLAMFIALETDELGRPTKVIYSTRIINEEKREIESLIRIAQTDELTGFLNRRTYENDIIEHNDYPTNENFIYISFDVNGLKIVNDTIGHAAGDEMLIGVCSCLRQILGPYGKLYRLGGDEFAGIVLVSDEMIKELLHTLDGVLNRWKGKLVDKISVSYGYATKREFPSDTVHQLAVKAEKRMYESKAAHYHRHGLDRRGQQEAHKALCALYTKILRINLTEDKYQIVNMNMEEKMESKGFSNSISLWLKNFGLSGQVHPDDLREYLEKTSLEYMRDYFKNNKNSHIILYRRKYEDSYKQVMMEIIPTSEYKDDYQDLFLYVKNIDK